MDYRRLHPWTVSIPRARRIQETLRDRISLSPLPSVRRPRLVAGADVSYNRGSADIYSAVVVLTYPEMEIVETASAAGTARVPYVPGYLSFREIPILLKAFRRIRSVPDVILCDGQGLAHPRGFGLACHLGAVLEVPTIGCAKSRLIGEHGEPGRRRGSRVPLRYEGRRVGTVLRTRDGVSPLFVSPGWGVDHRASTRITLACCRTRIPEPTRQAHMEVNRLRREHLEGGATSRPGGKRAARAAPRGGREARSAGAASGPSRPPRAAKRARSRSTAGAPPTGRRRGRSWAST